MAYDLHRRGRNNRLENDLKAMVLQSKVCIVISEPEEQK